MKELEILATQADEIEIALQKVVLDVARIRDAVLVYNQDMKNYLRSTTCKRIGE